MYVLKFGSFFLAESTPSDRTEEDQARATARMLVETARASPLVTRIVDEGMGHPSWTFHVNDDQGRHGVATGILGHVMFEAAWPAKNWSPASAAAIPDRLLISTDGVMYAVAADVSGDPPFEDDFELGRQAQNCLREIYGRLESHFIHSIGPTPMWPSIYFVHEPNTDKRRLVPVGDEGIVVYITDDEALKIDQFLLEAISLEADWAVVEHYGAMLEQTSFLQCDIALSEALERCFTLQKALWGSEAGAPANGFPGEPPGMSCGASCLPSTRYTPKRPSLSTC